MIRREIEICGSISVSQRDWESSEVSDMIKKDIYTMLFLLQSRGVTLSRSLTFHVRLHFCSCSSNSLSLWLELPPRHLITTLLTLPPNCTLLPFKPQNREPTHSHQHLDKITRKRRNSDTEDATEETGGGLGEAVKELKRATKKLRRLGKRFKKTRDAMGGD